MAELTAGGPRSPHKHTVLILVVTVIAFVAIVVLALLGHARGRVGDR
ncbi:hypothetical protein ACFPJ1_34270 [Kribbella qitaiheensis]